MTVLLPLALLTCAAEPNPAKLAAIEPAMRKYVENGTVAGVVTVVGTSKGIVQTDAIGQRTADPATPMPKNALFRIASMTKPMTAAGVLILADEGKLSIDDAVEKHLPEFRGQMLLAGRDKDGTVTLKKPSRKITLRDLLTHTSGLPFYPEGLGLYGKRDRSLAESILAVSQRPLDFEPGTKWAYCNSGIDTLGRVIEVVSGQSYEEFLAKRIFEPLGMKDTTFAPSKAQMSRLAGMFDSKGGKLIATPGSLIGPPAGSRHPIPAGGLYSTGADVARFYQMMLRGGEKVLSRDSVEAMTRVQTGDLKAGFTPGMASGLGFLVVKEPTGVTEALSAGSFGHGGAFGTQSWADPKKDLFVVLLIQRVNMGNSDASNLRRDLQKCAAEALAE